MNIPILYSFRARFKDSLKLALGAIVYPIQTRRWRSFLHEYPVLGELALRFPRIRHKIYRPYLSRHLGCADRVDALIGHYTYLFKLGLGDLVGQAAVHPVPVTEFEGKSGALFQLRLAGLNVGHREGELTLQLIQEGVCVYAATFVLIDGPAEPYIKLGALQGLRSAGGAQVIRQVTRELHGCRPKKLMVSLVRAIGMSLGCSTVRLVSNKNRITINGRRSRRISANYDETWEEMLAVRRPDGNFELPCMNAGGKNPALIPSHKRSEARRRNALLTLVCDAVRQNLAIRMSPERHCCLDVQ